MALQGPVCWLNIAKSGRLCQHSDVTMLNYVSFLADELAAVTKPLEPVAKSVPKKQLKEKVGAPRTHAMAAEDIFCWPVEDLGPAQTL